MLLPGAITVGTLGGINDFGELVGSIGGPSQGAIVTNGTVEMFTYPGSVETTATGINNRGKIVGWFGGATGEHGFVGTSGDLHSIDVPGSSGTRAEAINDWGQIVGSYTDAAGSTHGFRETPRGKFITIDVPQAQETTVTGINDWGQLVGSFRDTSGQEHGFVITAAHLQTLDIPGASYTTADGINNLGQIVGSSSATVTFGSGTSPGSQVWVATPQFIHQPQGNDVPLASTASDQAVFTPAEDPPSAFASVLGSSDWEDLRSALTSWTDLTEPNRGSVSLTNESPAISALQTWAGSYNQDGLLVAFR